MAGTGGKAVVLRIALIVMREMILDLEIGMTFSRDLLKFCPRPPGGGIARNRKRGETEILFILKNRRETEKILARDT